MLAYYGYTISPNQIETGEGFLICRNVPIARTGEQEYAGNELGLDTSGVVKVFRPPEEVFDPAALASFEGKPVTNDHPPNLVTPDDVSLYEMGHAQNIRRGEGEWDGYVLADLHIHDRQLIDAIQSGKREISCGYECEYADNGDGTYTQKRIRGNHIAVVDRGRAGKKAAILDAKKEREVNMFKKSFLELFGAASKDKSPEEISRLAMDAVEALEDTKEPLEEKPKEAPVSEDSKEKPYESIDEDVLDGLAEKIMAKIAEKQAAKETDPMQDMIEKLTGGEAEVQPEGDAFGEEAQTVPAEEMDGTGCVDKALAASILKAMQPTVAGIKDAKERTAVADALIRCVTTKDSANGIGQLLHVSQAAAKKRASTKKTVDYDAIQASYDAMNPHKKKEA